MYAEVILSPGEFARHDLTGKIAVVIDVFRFTTTVLTALEAGFDRFYPVSEIHQALALKEANPKLFLAGERNALQPFGFDFGNSPLSHFGKAYSGGDLICSTTNGTKAVTAAKGAEEVLLASLRSAEAVASYVQGRRKDLVFFPAGLEGGFSLEDTWCAGLILSYLDVGEWGDGAKTARLLQMHTPLAELAQSTHGRRLQGLGRQADLDFCLECNRSKGVVLWDQISGWGSLV